MHSWLKPWMLLPCCVAVLAAGQIWLSHLRYELSLGTQRMIAEQKEVRRESSKLRLETASLTRPDRLRQYANSKLGMAPPKPMQVIHL